MSWWWAVVACQSEGVVSGARQTVAEGDPPAGPPNVLVVLLDDVGSERLGLYGLRDDAPITPTIDGLAADGLVFTSAWAAPICSPTRAALMTGRLPSRTGVGDLIFTDREGYDLPLDEITIPEMLQVAPDAWDTSLVGKWHLGNDGGGVAALDDPGAQGFDWYAGSLSNLQDPWNGLPGLQFSYFDWMKIDNGAMTHREVYATTDTADDAIGRIAAMREPWFLYVAFNAGHEPFHEPPARLVHTAPQAEDGDADRYERMIEAMDTELGRILAAMDGELRARTTVFVMGDNGTPTAVTRPPLDATHAKGTVYELGVRVPFLVSGAGVAARGARSDALVNAVDVFPTVAELAGVRAVERPIDGVSLVPILSGASASVRALNYVEKFSPNGFGERTSDHRAVRDARYKLVVRWSREQGEEEELYDLLDSPYEAADLRGVPELDSTARALRAQLDAIRAGLAP